MRGYSKIDIVLIEKGEPYGFAFCMQIKQNRHKAVD